MVHPSLLIGEVNRAGEHYLDLAGKGMNTARILSQLGHTSIHLTHLGGEKKHEFIRMAEKDRVELLWADSHSEIRTCITILNDGRTTELVQEPEPVRSETEEPIGKLFSAALETVDGVIISGTRAGGYSQGLYPLFVKEAKEKGLFVLLDLKGDDLKNSLIHQPDVIKPNMSEFVQTFFNCTILEQEMNPSLESDVLDMMKEIHDRYGTITYLSRGKEESWIQGEAFHTVKPRPVKAVNTIGCGDTLSAVLAVELMDHGDLLRAAERATYWAGVNARHIRPGTIR
jgi:fructose-1-phosphate kinase PfkB-like protein